MPSELRVASVDEEAEGAGVFIDALGRGASLGVVAGLRMFPVRFDALVYLCSARKR